MAEDLIPAWFDARAIFAKFEQGKTSDTIATELGVKRHELVKHLKAHPEDFREMRAALQYIRMEDAHDAMDAAAEAGDYTKVKAFESVLRSAQWELERVYKTVYGEQKQDNAQPVQININLKRGPESLVITGIDDEPSHAAIPQADVTKATLTEEKPKAAATEKTNSKPKIHDRSVMQISAPVPPSPKPGEELDYSEGPNFA